MQKSKVVQYDYFYINTEERREEGLYVNIWISQQHNEAYFSPIKLNLILFTKVLKKNWDIVRTEILLSGKGGKIVH